MYADLREMFSALFPVSCRTVSDVLNGDQDNTKWARFLALCLNFVLSLTPVVYDLMACLTPRDDIMYESMNELRRLRPWPGRPGQPVHMQVI